MDIFILDMPASVLLYFNNWVYNSAGGQFVPEVVLRPVALCFWLYTFKVTSASTIFADYFKFYVC